MEVCEDSDNLKNRPLTPLRILRGLIILLIFLSTAFMFLLYFSPIFALALRLLSVHQSRKAICGHWLALWPYLFETVNGTTVVFSGDTLPVEKRVREIPAESSTWLMDSFQLKDKLLSGFNAQGQFPNQRQEEEEEEEVLSVMKCIATFGVVISLTGLFIYLTLYSHICFKVCRSKFYVSIFCYLLQVQTFTTCWLL